MAKFINDVVLDAQLEKVATGTNIHLCSSQPTTKTEADTTYQLASSTLTTGDGNGDYTIANGDVNGRKITISQQTGITVDNSGTGTHLAIVDATDVLLVTTITSQAVTAATTITFNAFDYSTSDPT